MADSYGPTFGGYSNVTDIVTAAAQTKIITQVNKLKALIPASTDTTSGDHPDFDQLSPRLADQLRLEIAALVTAIDAAPTS